MEISSNFVVYRMGCVSVTCVHYMTVDYYYWQLLLFCYREIFCLRHLLIHIL